MNTSNWSVVLYFLCIFYVDLCFEDSAPIYRVGCVVFPLPSTQTYLFDLVQLNIQPLLCRVMHLKCLSRAQDYSKSNGAQLTLLAAGVTSVAGGADCSQCYHSAVSLYGVCFFFLTQPCSSYPSLFQNFFFGLTNYQSLTAKCLRAMFTSYLQSLFVIHLQARRVQFVFIDVMRVMRVNAEVCEHAMQT